MGRLLSSFACAKTDSQRKTSCYSDFHLDIWLDFLSYLPLQLDCLPPSEHRLYCFVSFNLFVYLSLLHLAVNSHHWGQCFYLSNQDTLGSEQSPLVCSRWTWARIVLRKKALRRRDMHTKIYNILGFSIVLVIHNINAYSGPRRLFFLAIFS